VASVMPTSMGMARYLVANVKAISWLLSPSSATKMIAKLMRSAPGERLERPAELRQGLRNV
jgi:hypothetical protein